MKFQFRGVLYRVKNNREGNKKETISIQSEQVKEGEIMKNKFLPLAEG